MAVRTRDLALVAVGGVLGSLTRYAVGTAFAHPHPAGAWPWATFTVNLVASLLVGLVAGFAYWRHAAHWVRPLAMTGFLGGLSTFSAFAVDTITLSEGGSATLATAYVVVTFVACVVAVGAGTAVAQRIWQQR